MLSEADWVLSQDIADKIIHLSQLGWRNKYLGLQMNKFNLRKQCFEDVVGELSMSNNYYQLGSSFILVNDEIENEIFLTSESRIKDLDEKIEICSKEQDAVDKTYQKLKYEINAALGDRVQLNI